MTGETLTTDGAGRAVLRMRRRFTHPPEKVWRALTEPAELSQWYPQSAMDIDLRVGGTIHFDMGSDPDTRGGSVMEATIIELDPPRVFAFTVPSGDHLANEGENLLRFELQPEGDGCVLVFTHVFHDRPFAAAYAAGWTMCLNAMASLLDDRAITWLDSMVETFEEYVRAFDLSAGTVEESADGWRLRFDRQLMQQPADKVWSALVDRTPKVGDPAPATATTDSVPAGAVTAIQPGVLLEYEWLADDDVAGRVRWELTTTNPGARVTLTQTGPPDRASAQRTALVGWRDHIERLVHQVLETHP